MASYTAVPTHTLRRIRKLLDEGLDVSAIAERLDVAESTVYAVKHGRARPKVRKDKITVGHRGIRLFDPVGEVAWCDRYKATVHVPCLACQVRKLGAEKQNGRERIMGLSWLGFATCEHGNGYVPPEQPEARCHKCREAKLAAEIKRLRARLANRDATIRRLADELDGIRLDLEVKEAQVQVIRRVLMMPADDEDE